MLFVVSCLFFVSLLVLVGCYVLLVVCCWLCVVVCCGCVLLLCVAVYGLLIIVVRCSVCVAGCRRGCGSLFLLLVDRGLLLVGGCCLVLLGVDCLLVVVC